MKKLISRRRFLTIGGLSTISGTLWVSQSESVAGRSLPQPSHRPTPGDWTDNALTVSWLGHATVLINFYGFNILTDPVLFPRVGANLGIGTIGPKRLVAPALTVDLLPRIDLVLLSHAHMDHLDFPTLHALASQPKVVTARATGDLFPRKRFPEVTELGWGESCWIQGPKGKTRVQAFQVRHWGARWRRDTHRGYNGYLLEREGRKIIFGGDTAFTASFAELRSRGPFHLAIMPIGSYAPWIGSHCTPEQAVDMANAAGANHIVPIHHRTFRLGREGPVEPMQRLEAALAAEPERIAIRDVGQTFRSA